MSYVEAIKTAIIAFPFIALIFTIPFIDALGKPSYHPIFDIAVNQMKLYVA